jgi:asparagine synthetase B (glutamine-hydrolysing)
MVTKQLESCLDLSFLEDYLSSHLVKSSAKVLMSGLGADEVFGGYARYSTAFKRGLKELEEEIGLDLDRLWERNFGRDDRVISGCGKE